jgi:hypothetical protein
MAKNENSNQLQARRWVDVPLREVSGICLRRGPKGQRFLVVISDREAKVAWFLLPGGEEADLDWRTSDISRHHGSELPAEDPQIEAVCSDGVGRVFLLQETPPRVEIVDPEAQEVVGSIDLEVEGADEIARDWRHAEGSRGEGMVLLPGGHLLVAKEKNPAVLIEFGPRHSRSRGLVAGDALADGERWSTKKGRQRYIALATWLPEKSLAKACADFSDLEIGPDGRLYLLSDKSSSIALIGDLSAGGGSAALIKAWRIGKLDGKPEGLAFTAQGCAVVGLDTRKRRNNLVLLEPAIAGSSHSRAG